jgi:predicted lipid-binding transport protein (Tim44 family)
MAALRRSVSIMPSAKRSSKIATRHLSASTFGSLNTQGPLIFENKDVLEMDDTPTGAMRKLLGSSSRPHHLMRTDRAVSATKTSTLHAQTISPSKSAATHPANPVEQPLHVQPSVTLPQLDADQVKALLQMLAVTSDVNDKAKVLDDKVLLQTLERIEKAEKAAEAREERLRTMLEEVSHRMIPADDQARANCS